MRKVITLFIIGICSTGFTQVFNQGVDQVYFQNLAKHGLTYVKTGDDMFDSTIIAALEEMWTVSEVTVIERLDRPEKNSSVLFVTEMEPTREYFKDRKNKKVLVLYPGAYYKVKKDDVNMSLCLGYMFFNGFYDLLDQKNEHLFAKMMIGSLNEGLKWIKEHSLKNVGKELNASISASIIAESGTPLGNTLLIHREQTRSLVNMKLIEKSKIRHRLIGEDEYYKLIEARDRTHFVLYIAQNEFTEVSIINIHSGKIVYTKHFYEPYTSLSKKEVKQIAVYFG